jgi:hypothetical protein
MMVEIQNQRPGLAEVRRRVVDLDHRATVSHGESGVNRQVVGEQRGRERLQPRLDLEVIDGRLHQRELAGGLEAVPREAGPAAVEGRDVWIAERAPGAALIAGWRLLDGLAEVR